MTTKDWQAEVEAAALGKFPIVWMHGNDINHDARIGFDFGASWAREKLAEREAKLIWLVRHAIFTASISRAKGAELLGIPLIDLDEALKAWRGEG